MDREAMVIVASCPDTTFVRLDDRAADRQAHAESLGLGRDEWLEDTGQLRFRYSDSGVADRDDDKSLPIVIGRNSQRPRSALDDRDGITRVEQQVQDHLLQLHGVSRDVW